MHPALRKATNPNGNNYLIGERGYFFFSDALMHSIIAELDSKKTDEEVVARLSSRYDPAVIYFHLLQLEKKGHIIDASKCNKPVEDAWWFSTGNRVEKVHDILSHYAISVTTDDDATRQALLKALQAIGFQTNGNSDIDSIEIVICDDYLDPKVRTTVSSTVRAGRSCFPAKITGRTIWFGPLISNNNNFCWDCLIAQLRRNRPVESYLEKAGVPYSELIQRPSFLPPTLSIAVNFVVLRLLCGLLENQESKELPSIATLDLWTLESNKHVVRNVPQCSACGNPESFAQSVRKPLELKECPKRYGSDGGYRTMLPEETWENNKHLVSAITGIISSIGPLSAKNHDLRPVFGATYFVHPPIYEVAPDETFVGCCFGKGRTPSQARVSALCETIERSAAIYQGDEPILRGDFATLKTDAVHPIALLRYSERQYKDRDLTTTENIRRKIPLPFKEDQAIAWTYAWSLTHNKHRLVPAAYCYSYFPTPESEKICFFDSNGNAAGNTIEEAILQGLLELIERDAVAIWWYNRINRPAIDVHSLHDPYVSDISNHYAELEWDLWILDLTHDLRIPTAVSVAKNRVTDGIIIGMGCHIEMRLAIQRAVTEMNQVFDKNGSPLWLLEEIESPEYLFPDKNAQSVRASDYIKPVNKSITSDILHCQTIIESAGMELIVLDYTRPDIKLPTVKVIVPGLRHFWQRLGPGRLYDVPVELGWLHERYDENELNPKALVL